MPIVPMTELLGSAFKKRYGVGAFNIVNDLSMAAVLEAAVQTDSPVILQVSLKTVKFFGPRLLQRMFEEMASAVPIPTTLHLDHCPDVAAIKACLDAGWNSVLFDASSLSYEENLRQTKEVVAMARKCGAAVEGELEAVHGVEDGVGSEEEGELVPLDKCVEFLDQTGIDLFAPAIGTAHGLYKKAPKIDFERVKKIVALRPVPIVLHGGTGLSDDVFKRCDGYRNYLDAKPQEHDPLKAMSAVRQQMITMAKGFMETFGSAGQAGTKQLAEQSHG